MSAEGGRASSKCLALGSSQPPLWAMERDSQAKCNQRQVLNLWGRKRKHQMSSVTWKTKIQSWEPTTQIITTPFQDMTMKSPPSFLLPSPSVPALSHSSPALPPVISITHSGAGAFLIAALSPRDIVVMLHLHLNWKWTQDVGKREPSLNSYVSNMLRRWVHLILPEEAVYPHFTNENPEILRN